MAHDLQPDPGRTELQGYNPVEPLSEEFLYTLVAELDKDDIIGIILGGSYARNEASLR